MFGYFKNMRLNGKVSLLGVASVLTTALVLLTLAVWQSGQYNKLAQSEVDQLIAADLDHITQGVYNLVQTENEAVQQQVNYNLNVAQHILSNTGEVSFSEETVTWTVTNQFTEETTRVQLPKMLIGNQWLGQNSNPAIQSFVVDEVEKLIGDTATIFQRMDENGNMLRVATTVRNADGERAIGTYIPAIDPDGTANPVISTVVGEGGTYHGRAFVVDQWYITAYQPIYDSTGNLAGMLYVGVKQKTVEERVRQAIIQTRVGETGYVYILGGKGAERGHYIISKDGTRDGEDIWESQDAEGRYFIQDIVEKAIVLKPGEMATERYPWQNIGESTPRWKIVRLAYYEPWDWIIGTSAYEDELQMYQKVLNDGRIQMISSMGFTGVLISLIIGLVGIFFAWTITRPVKRLTTAAETITQGDLSQVVDVHSRDELGLLADAFNRMTSELRESLEALQRSERKLRAVVYGSPIPQFVIGPDHHVVFWNKAIEEITGIKANEMIGTQQHWKAFYAEVRPCMADLLVDGALDAIPDWYSGKFKQSSLVADAYAAMDFFPNLGEHGKWLYFTAVPIKDANGITIGAVETLEDITDRIRADAAIRESELKYRNLHESMRDGYAYVSMDGVVQDSNATYQTMLGYTFEELQQKTYLELTPSKWHQFEDDIVKNQVLVHGFSQVYEKEYCKKDGTIFPVELRTFLIKDIDGKPQGMWAIIRDITERKQAEAALQQANLVVENSPVVLFRWRAVEGWPVELVSNNVTQFGYAPEELLSGEIPFTQIMHSEDIERISREIQEYITNGIDHFQQEYRLVTKDGNIRWIDDRTVIERDADGQICSFQGIVIDITERKESEEALRESEKQVRRKLDAILSPDADIGALELSDIIDSEKIQNLMDKFFELTNIGIGIIDLHGKVLVGTGWQDICTKFHRVHPLSNQLCIESDLELSQNVPIGTFKQYHCKNHMWDIATPIMLGDTHVGNIFLGQFLFDDELPDYEIFRQQAHNYGFNEQEYMAALDRVPRWSHEKVNATMSFYAAFATLIGNLSYSNIKLANALHERMLAEEALNYERTLLERVMETSPIGITTIDKDGQILFANYQAEKIFGLTRNEITKRTYNAPEWKIMDFSGNPFPEAELPFVKVMSSRKPIFDVRHTIQWPDGKEIFLSINAAPLLDEAGHIDGMVASINDITERVHMEDEIRKAHDELEERVRERTSQLEAANKELESFSYSVSHDLRAPLRSMDGYSHIILEDYGPDLPPDAQSYLNRIHDNAIHMGNLIDDLLAFSRLGRQSLDKQTVSMTDLVKQILENLEADQKKRRIDLKIGVLPDCMGDPAMLRQVWVNLISNAFKFTNGYDPTTIEIGCLNTNHECVYYVKDNGAGFDMQYADKLFGVFQRLHSDRDFEGTGVGLAIVQRIIHRHGGRVWAEAQEGQGATFYFTVAPA